MSLQEIERSNIKSGTAGLDRKIDSSSEKMMLDILQVTQYMKPIESTVRELASNAMDAVKEKEVALDIITGKAKVSYYFIEREGKQYADSKWTPEYYDLEHLDQKNFEVELRYEEGEGSGFCDNFIVFDPGVGLGMPRLAGYFRLGFSTKRNSASAFGAFGLGAKAPLSTLTDHYTMETVHNGKKFRFNCYAYKIDSLVPPMDMENKTMNKKVNIGSEEEPYWAHYEETDEKNYTKIITPVKRHNRQRYIQAVKHQLLYFDRIKFSYKYENGHEESIPFLADVLHNSESILISNTRQFNRPHVLIVKEKGSKIGVTYGTIDFQELEMEQLNGSVGFKCPIRSVIRDEETGEETIVQEGVSVTPSRESVIWDEHTRKYIQGVIEDAQDEASKLISKELKEKDFMKWVNKAHDVISRASGNHYGSPTALSTLSKLIDRSKLSAEFPGDKTIKYKSNPISMFKGLNPRYCRKQRGSWDRATKDYSYSIERSDLNTWSHFREDALYLIGEDSRPSKTKDLYLNGVHNGGFVLFKRLDIEAITKAISETNSKITGAALTKKATQIKEHADKIFDYLQPYLKSYEDIVVPETFEKKVEEKKKTPELTPKEKRELQGKVVCYTFAYKEGSYGMREYKREKKEPKLALLDKIPHQVVYGTQKDDDALLAVAAFHHTKAQSVCEEQRPDFFILDKIVDKDWELTPLVRFSKRNLKHVKENPNYIHVNKYLFNHKDGEYNIGTYFRGFFTARYIQNRLKKLKFLNNFEEFNEQLSQAYQYLADYLYQNYEKHGSRVFGNEYFQEYMELADKGIEFQMFARDNEEEEVLKAKSSEIFGHDKITKAHVIDETILELVEELESYSDGVGGLFNSVSFLVRIDENIPETAARLINEVLDSHDLTDFNLTEDSIKIFENKDNK